MFLSNLDDCTPVFFCVNIILLLHVDRKCSAAWPDRSAGDARICMEPRNNLWRALFSGAQGVRLVQGGGGRGQAEQGMLACSQGLFVGLRRHWHLQHLHSCLPFFSLFAWDPPFFPSCEGSSVALPTCMDVETNTSLSTDLKYPDFSLVLSFVRKRATLIPVFICYNRSDKLIYADIKIQWCNNLKCQISVARF